MTTIRKFLIRYFGNMCIVNSEKFNEAEAELNTLIKAEKIKFARECKPNIDEMFTPYEKMDKPYNPDVRLGIEYAIAKMEENIRKFEEDDDAKK
jgi:hypothetical protein